MSYLIYTDLISSLLDVDPRYLDPRIRSTLIHVGAKDPNSTYLLK